MDSLITKLDLPSYVLIDSYRGLNNRIELKGIRIEGVVKCFLRVPQAVGLCCRFIKNILQNLLNKLPKHTVLTRSIERMCNGQPTSAK